MADAQAVLNQYRSQLMALPYVTGVAVSNLAGENVILVLMSRKPLPSEYLPSYIDGVRVVTRITGTIQVA
jgi:hypothetical protein